MESDRFLYLGKPHDYCETIRGAISKYRKGIKDIHAANSGLNMKKEGNGEVIITLGLSKIIKPGSQIDLEKYPLRFRDGSVMAIVQRIRYEHGACWVIESIIRFAKLDASDRVQYVFHYDTVLDVPDHPDHHLQFEYNPTVNTPRFPLRAYEDLDTILHMIIRDKIAC